MKAFGSRLAHPAVILTVVILAASALYLLRGSRGARVAREPSAQAARDAKALVRRNWLFLAKAVRLKTYADYAAGRKKEELAAYSYRRARSALEEVQRGTEREIALMGRRRTITQEEKRALAMRAAGLWISIAACRRGEGDISGAREALGRGIETGGRTRMAARARYRLGRLFEDDLREYRAAIDEYRQCQHHTVKFTHLIEEMLASLSKPGDRRKLDGTAETLAGGFDPAEAQYRVIRCCQELGLEEAVKEEKQILVDTYPLSEWGEQLQESEGIVPRTRMPSLFEEPEKKPVKREEKKPDETLEIVPLNEDS